MKMRITQEKENQMINSNYYQQDYAVNYNPYSEMF